MWLTAADVSRRLPERWPVGLVIGDEPLLVEEAADVLRASARQQGFTERRVLEAGGNFDWGLLTAEASAMSLFGDRQLIELRLPEAKAGAEGGKALQAFVSAQSPDVALLVIAPTTGAAKDTAWMTRIAELGPAVRCRRLAADKLPQWLGQRARGLKLDISPEALQWLAEQVEGNLLAAHQELVKLPLLRATGRWALEDLQAVVSDHARYAGYDLPDVLLAGDLAAGLRMIRSLRENGTAPPLLMYSLGRDIRSLHAAGLRAAQSGPERACEAVGIWRNRQAHFAACLRRLPMAEIRRLHLLVVGLEKTSKSAPEARFWEDLVNFAVRLCGPAGRQVA